MPTVRLERDGLFGPVGVVDTADARRFTIGGVLQGASLLRPDAKAADPSLGGGPGAVIETRYQLAWLMAGQRHPDGCGVMLGLGGGCGAVGLLHEFPGLHLDAVEGDPAMARMAREFHPLVSHFERLGRLRIHVSEAEDYLARTSRRYDFAITDLVINADSLPAVDSEPLIRAVAQAAAEVWFRVFGSLPDGEIQPAVDKLSASGKPVSWLFSPISAHVQIPRQRDWILAGGVAQPPGPDAFVPFRSASGPRVRAVRLAYRKLVAEAMRIP